MGIWSIICGAVGIILGWVPVVNYFALPIAILGIVLGALGRKEAEKAEKSTGVATTGLILSVIGVICAGLGVLACTVCAAGLGNTPAKVPDAPQELLDAANSTLEGAKDTLENLNK